MTKYLMEQGKINNFRNQKAGNKFEGNFRKKGTQAIFFRVNLREGLKALRDFRSSSTSILTFF